MRLMHLGCVCLHLMCFFLCSKLTRESGTDFPIPTAPNVADTETEKLIREKDEEVQLPSSPANHDAETEPCSDPPAVTHTLTSLPVKR